MNQPVSANADNSPMSGNPVISGITWPPFEDWSACVARTPVPVRVIDVSGLVGEFPVEVLPEKLPDPEDPANYLEPGELDFQWLNTGIPKERW